MTQRRFVRAGSDEAKKHNPFVLAHELPAHQKRAALKFRMSYTQKRATPEEEAEQKSGKYKARLMAMDQKCIHAKPGQMPRILKYKAQITLEHHSYDL